MSCRRRYFPAQTWTNDTFNVGLRELAERGAWESWNGKILSLRGSHSSRHSAPSDVCCVTTKFSPSWKFSNFSMFALCQLCFIPDLKISFKLKIITHFCFMRKPLMHFAELILTVKHFMNLSQSEPKLWLNPRGKLLRIDNEGLWWLKLVPVSTCGGCGGKIVCPPLRSQLTDIMPGLVCLGSTVSQSLVSLQ